MPTGQPGYPPSPTAIDHSAYPHIMDMIFAAAPHASLLALRGASSAFRDRVDEMLALHLSITPEDTRSVLGRHPAFHPDNRNYNYETVVVDCHNIAPLDGTPAPGSHVYLGRGAEMLRLYTTSSCLFGIIKAPWVVNFLSPEYGCRPLQPSRYGPQWQAWSRRSPSWSRPSDAFESREDTGPFLEQVTHVFPPSSDLNSLEYAGTYEPWRPQSEVFLFLMDELEEYEGLSFEYCFPDFFYGSARKRYTIVNADAVKFREYSRLREEAAPHDEYESESSSLREEAAPDDESESSPLHEEAASDDESESSPLREEATPHDESVWTTLKDYLELRRGCQLKYITVKEYQDDVGPLAFKLETDPDFHFPAGPV
jgi:hypothetical protein